MIGGMYISITFATKRFHWRRKRGPLNFRKYEEPLAEVHDQMPVGFECPPALKSTGFKKNLELISSVFIN